MDTAKAFSLYFTAEDQAVPGAIEQWLEVEQLGCREQHPKLVQGNDAPVPDHETILSSLVSGPVMGGAALEISAMPLGPLPHYLGF